MQIHLANALKITNSKCRSTIILLGVFSYYGQVGVTSDYTRGEKPTVTTNIALFRTPITFHGIRLLDILGSWGI